MFRYKFTAFSEPSMAGLKPIDSNKILFKTFHSF